MNVRRILGVLFILYAVIGFSILFVPVASAYFEGVASSFSGNPSISGFFSFFDPFSSVLESFLWFGLCLSLGPILVFYRRLLTKQKPPWMTRPISEPKNLG